LEAVRSEAKRTALLDRISQRCAIEFTKENTMTDLKFAYELCLTPKEKETADWLDAHGYFSAFHATLQDDPEGGNVNYVYGMTEPQAWEFAEGAEDDAFLSCNGSKSLAEKVYALLDSIV
jgi:hypothetical protein